MDIWMHVSSNGALEKEYHAMVNEARNIEYGLKKKRKIQVDLSTKNINTKIS